MNYENRPRLSYEDAQRILLNTTSPMVAHLTINDDETYSIVWHINCEWCDHCDVQGDCRGRMNPKAVPSKEDIYENHK